MTLRAPDFADEIVAIFEERDAALTDIAIIQPADPFLDMAGEDLRRRIFLTESETGANLCLRPEFTIPVCRDHIDKRAATPQRYAYLGEVFRQQREGGAEFLQAGIEDLGTSDRAGADARSLADAHALLTRVLPGETLSVTLGDQAVFEAVLAALGLPRGWQMRLTRAFGSQTLLQAALDDLANPQGTANLPRAIAGLVARGDETALAEHVGTVMEETGLSPSAGRTPEEIARRLIEKAELRSVRLTDEAMSALKAFVSLRVPLAEAGERLSAFAADNGLILDDALETFAARAERIEAEGLPLDALTYDAGFGRPLDYYTGFVFEIAASDAVQPLAGGGRYDRLLTLLGAETPIPGVGFSIWLDRVAALRETAA
ncbi:ATP phosphoribosyltransferase regulatory subunit [Nitratireductor aquimarinus]|uniref:ATP phosphoribosyltransferase regulatory subunit n=1 Tax=Alphaproteobacteria TaxID=28211 RepID=UPI0019D3CAC8|nr:MULTISPECIES: ATP phosphoribosyltransferase regulatory subunit [Alphaproteobacteria]MBN7755642.1 ATP phosphoribosyltransferase regulatory subunit [Nitratireductor aquimarinus]MBY5998397.1 ATP phosphoribosyltransferase regulatory subunit [Tritonibacter mobilis]MBY6020428.1 ATP phosphoribosyltransferase regulatory subunit [Nitratireductor sp. DP7N14-4]